MGRIFNKLVNSHDLCQCDRKPPFSFVKLELLAYRRNLFLSNDIIIAASQVLKVSFLKKPPVSFDLLATSSVSRRLPGSIHGVISLSLLDNPCLMWGWKGHRLLQRTYLPSGTRTNMAVSVWIV